MKKSATYIGLWMKRMGSHVVWIFSSTKVSPTSFALLLLEKGKLYISLYKPYVRLYDFIDAKVTCNFSKFSEEMTGTPSEYSQ